jgi:iron complex transport system ATP-binding protein
MLAVELQDVFFAYDDNDVLRGVSLQVAQGAFLGIIGPNGSGKTTLLRVISKAVTPRRGRCLVEGRDIGRVSQRECARLVAVVPQESEFAFPYTVEQVVLMGRYPHSGGWHLDSAADRRAAREAMETTDVLEFADRLIFELSGGEKQRVIIARALAQRSRILLLDEATSFLDIKHQLEIYRLVERLNREDGLTVISVEHDLNIASEFARELALLDQGRICEVGSPVQVITQDNLKQVFKSGMYLGRNPDTGSPFVLPVGEGSSSQALTE